MRTATDIVADYRGRGYDSFRIRAIAALRPEPVRGQILEILDAEEEQASSGDIGVTSYTLPDSADDCSEPPQAELSADFQELAEEDAEMVADVLASSVEPTYAGDSEEEDRFWENDGEEGELLTLEEDFESVEPEDIRIPLSELQHRSETVDEMVEGDEARNGQAQVGGEARDPQRAMQGDSEGVREEEGAPPASPQPTILLPRARRQQVEIVYPAPAEPVQGSLFITLEASSADEVEDEQTEELSAGSSNPDQSILRPVAMDAEDTTILDAEECRVLYLYDSMQKGEEIDWSEADLSLFCGDEAEDDHWVDCGSGLILLPKQAHDQQNAYRRAGEGSQGEPQEESAPDRNASNAEPESVPSVQEAGSVKQEEHASVNTEPRTVPSHHEVEQDTVSTTEQADESDAYGCAEGTETALAVRSELAEVEAAVNRLESCLNTTREENEQLRALLGKKDELLRLLSAQNEEGKGKLARREAEIAELKAANGYLHKLSEENQTLRLQFEDAERERNILKYESVPNLEEQQLQLVEMMEQEQTSAQKAQVRARRAGRRSVLSGTLAAAASLALALSPGLSLQATDAPSQPKGAAADPALQLVSQGDNELRARLHSLSKRVERLQEEKEALHASYREKETTWKRQEGRLRRQLAQRDERLQERQVALSRELRDLRNERDQALGRLAQVRRAPSPPHDASGITRARPTANTGDNGQDPAAQASYYTVERGDTFSEIVRSHYGTARRSVLNRVARENNIGNVNAIHVGQRLKLPAMPELGSMALVEQE
jgi:nucleoid-associated protein YgaU